MTIPVVTFTSDFGTDEEFVGVCHSVIVRIAPQVRIIDLAHGVHGLRAGAAVLAQSVGYAPPGAVHLAVVDPGVGTSRRPIVISVASGSHLVGPDNGLLVAAADVLGGIDRVHELSEARYRLEPVSATFHGRDIFAPAAAHLASDADPASFGAPIRPDDLVLLPPALLEVREGSIVAEPVRVDPWGNVQLPVTPSDLDVARIQGPLVVGAQGRTWPARRVRTFGDLGPGELGVLVDSTGHVALVLNGARASELMTDATEIEIRATG